MDIEKIKKAKTKLIGKEIEYYQKINSTSIYAKTIAEKEKNNGKIIIAEEQTSGVGTKGKSWYTGNQKNIAMTIILKPKCEIKKLDGLTIKIAQIIQKSINQIFNYKLQIKEPNDLMIDNKKVAGILTEISTIGTKINYLLIGIGLNVNEENFSEEIIGISTSLKKELKKDCNREEIIIKIIENLEEEIEL